MQVLAPAACALRQLRPLHPRHRPAAHALCEAEPTTFEIRAVSWLVGQYEWRLSGRARWRPAPNVCSASLWAPRRQPQQVAWPISLRQLRCRHHHYQAAPRVQPSRNRQQRAMLRCVAFHIFSSGQPAILSRSASEKRRARGERA